MSVRFLCFFLWLLVGVLQWPSTVQPYFCAACALHVSLNIADIFSLSLLTWFGADLSVFCLDPHRAHADRTENGWIPPGRKFQPFSSFAPHSHDLVHKTSHLFRGLLLLLAGGVGVGAEGKPSIVVSQHTADGFHVYTVL